MKKSLWVFVCLTALAGFLLIRLLLPTSVRATTGSLAALWHFDEGAGTSAFDSSGNGNVGVLTGATLPTFVPGKFETAINFDGVNDFVSVSDSPSLELTQSFTVEMWINPATTVPQFQALLVKGGGLGVPKNYGLFLEGANLELEYNPGGATACLGTIPISTGAWHHVAATYVAGLSTATVNLYVDGVLDTTCPSLALTVADNLPLQIGAQFNNPYYYQGVIDEVRIWNRSLGANEVLASAQAGLHALWHFNEASGTTTADSSGYSNTGTLNGGAAFTSSNPLANFGNSLSLGGTTGFVSVPNNSTLNPPSAITVEAWIRITDYGFYPSVASKGNVGNFLESYALFVDPGGALGFLVNSNGTSGGRGIVIAGGPIAKGSWAHVAGTYDGSTVKVYINGAQVGSTAQTGPINPTLNPVLIGKSDRTSTPSPFADSFFNGQIDEVHIWARALSGNEIKFLAGVDPTPACTDSNCAGELLLPEEIDQEVGYGTGAVYAQEWDYGGPANPRHAMGLEFIVSDDASGSITILPPSNGLIVPSCVTDKGSTPGPPVIGGLDGCEIGTLGKSAFITGTQTTNSRSVPATMLHILVNLSDSERLGAKFNWQ